MFRYLSDKKQRDLKSVCCVRDAAFHTACCDFTRNSAHASFAQAPHELWAKYEFRE